MSLLPRRAAHKKELELTVYTRVLQIIFLEVTKAGDEETSTLLFPSRRMENKRHCKHPEQAFAVQGRALSSSAGAQGPGSVSSDGVCGNFPCGMCFPPHPPPGMRGARWVPHLKSRPPSPSQRTWRDPRRPGDGCPRSPPRHPDRSRHPGPPRYLRIKAKERVKRGAKPVPQPPHSAMLLLTGSCSFSCL